jgi:hypothetical protein
LKNPGILVFCVTGVAAGSLTRAIASIGEPSASERGDGTYSEQPASPIGYGGMSSRCGARPVSRVGAPRTSTDDSGTVESANAHGTASASDCRGHAAGERCQWSPAAWQSCVTLRDSARETLTNVSITGHLRCFPDQPVANVADFANLDRCFDDAVAREVMESISDRSQTAQGALAGGGDPLRAFQHEVRRLVDTAILSFDVLRAGTVGLDGAPGACSIAA